MQNSSVKNFKTSCRRSQSKNSQPAKRQKCDKISFNNSQTLTWRSKSQLKLLKCSLQEPLSENVKNHEKQGLVSSSNLSLNFWNGTSSSSSRQSTSSKNSETLDVNENILETVRKGSMDSPIWSCRSCHHLRPSCFQGPPVSMVQYQLRKCLIQQNLKLIEILSLLPKSSAKSEAKHWRKICRNRALLYNTFGQQWDGLGRMSKPKNKVFTFDFDKSPDSLNRCKKISTSSRTSILALKRDDKKFKNKVKVQTKEYSAQNPEVEAVVTATNPILDPDSPPHRMSFKCMSNSQGSSPLDFSVSQNPKAKKGKIYMPIISSRDKLKDRSISKFQSRKSTGGSSTKEVTLKQTLKCSQLVDNLNINSHVVENLISKKLVPKKYIEDYAWNDLKLTQLAALKLFLLNHSRSVDSTNCQTEEEKRVTSGPDSVKTSDVGSFSDVQVRIQCTETGMDIFQMEEEKRRGLDQMEINQTLSKISTETSEELFTESELLLLSAIKNWREKDYSLELRKRIQADEKTKLDNEISGSEGPMSRSKSSSSLQNVIALGGSQVNQRLTRQVVTDGYASDAVTGTSNSLALNTLDHTLDVKNERGNVYRGNLTNRSSIGNISPDFHSRETEAFMIRGNLAILDEETEEIPLQTVPGSFDSVPIRRRNKMSRCVSFSDPIALYKLLPVAESNPPGLDRTLVKFRYPHQHSSKRSSHQ